VEKKFGATLKIKDIYDRDKLWKKNWSNFENQSQKREEAKETF
jgi:hypothetical protein